MIKTKKVLKRLGEMVIPIKYEDKIRTQFIKAGFSELPMEFFGTMSIINLLVTLLSYFLLILPWVQGEIISSIFGFVFFFAGLYILELLGIYFYLDIKIFKRKTDIENNLDKFLQQVSDSLKGGMTFDKALWGSAKEEFGVVSQEIKIVAKTATTGKDIESSLRKFMNKYDSPTIKRTFSLISEGIRGGGKITNILDRVVVDLRETRKLNREMKTAVLNYIIFISSIVMVVAPGLFAVAGQLLEVLSQFVRSLSVSLSSAGSALPIKVSAVSVNTADFTLFSNVSLAIISIFAAMIVSIITRGNIKSGLKYIPLFLAVSLITYAILAQLMIFVFGAFG